MINICLERYEFLEYLPEKSVGAEIGVFKGNFSKDILRIVKPSSLHLIDTWWRGYGEFYPDWGAYTNFGNLSTRNAYYEVLRNIDSDRDSCHIHIGNSVDILSNFPDHFFDWVYLDSSHEFNQTIEELGIIDTKIKEGGLITGHDWFPDPNHIHHGVYEAIIKFMEITDWKLTYLDNHTQWALAKIIAPTGE